jgi:hypothetical protein
MHLPAFLQIKTALLCRATWLDVITALALHSASSRACCGRCLRCFSPPLPAVHPWWTSYLWLGQSNQIVCEASAALLYCQAITPTNTERAVPSRTVRILVPQENLRPDSELRASAEQNGPHHTNDPPSGSLPGIIPFFGLQTPPQGCLVMLAKRRFAKRDSVRYRCS